MCSVPRVELDVDAAAGEAVQEGTDGAGAGTGSASQGSAGTAFPGMDLDRMVVDDLDKVHNWSYAGRPYGFQI